MGDWKVRLPLYAAGLATGGAFSFLFTSGALPYLLGAAFLALLVGSTGAYRYALLFPVTAGYTLVILYGAPPLSLSGWRGLGDRIARDVYEAATIMYANPVPYDPHPGLLVVLIPMIFIIVAFTTSATLYEDSPVISVAVLGLTIGILSTVSFESGAGPFFAVFLLSSVALLLLTGDETRWGTSPRTSAVVAGLAVALLALALPNLPVAKEAIQPAAVDWTRLGTGGTSRLAVQADVGNYLTEGRDEELMRVTSREPLLWRGGTLDHFDGVRWSSTVESGDDDGAEISPSVPTYNLKQRVEILEAETNLLFGAYRVDSVSVEGAQRRSDSSWATMWPLTEGSSYEVVSRIPQPTTEQLEAAGTFYPATVQEKFLQLPADRPEVLGQTARTILDDYDPQTPYQAARAIERYLIYDGGFRYNINADFGRGDRAIEEFLGGSKQGFCTQFATSMALLAREMGVPSRVVYGTTSGDEVGPREYVITGYDVHTWVEIYFPGVGWYPFDPTPGFSVPATMQANAPRPELPIPEYNASLENPAPRQQEPSEPPQALEPLPDGDFADTEQSSTRAPYFVLPPIMLILLLVAVPFVKSLLASRGRPEDRYRELVGRLRDVSPLGGAVASDSPALTPTERLSLLARVAGLDEGPFREFARAYSERLYAQNPSLSLVRPYQEALGEYRQLPRWKRTLASLNPASLLLRARRRTAQFWIQGHKALRRLKRK